MKKKIFIFNYFMYIGGAERALLGLLNAFDYTKYEVDLFLALHQGEFLHFIPKEVNLLPEDKMYASYAIPLKKVLFSKTFPIGVARLIARWKFNKYKKRKNLINSEASFQYIIREMMPFLAMINPNKEYDLAISFLAPHNIVLDKVKAKKKICWIHTDYTQIDVNVDLELPVWSRYDYIASISTDVTRTFLQVFPSLKDKIVEIENILSPRFVRERADLENVQEELEQSKSINLLSIGRFSDAKNYDNVPDICSRMLRILNANALNENENENQARSATNQGASRLTEAQPTNRAKRLTECEARLTEPQATNRASAANQARSAIKWYIIGYGGGEELIRQKIREAGMENHVIILGKRSNPYPYIKACDIYVQPSRYEGKSVTVREAQMLCKPIVVTNYPTASSQIRDGVDGVIVPMDNEGCAQGIARVILDAPLRQRLTAHLATHDYGNEAEVDKIYSLLG